MNKTLWNPGVFSIYDGSEEESTIKDVSYPILITADGNKFSNDRSPDEIIVEGEHSST